MSQDIDSVEEITEEEKAEIEQRLKARVENILEEATDIGEDYAQASLEAKKKD